MRHLAELVLEETRLVHVLLQHDLGCLLLDLFVFEEDGGVVWSVVRLMGERPDSRRFSERGERRMLVAGALSLIEAT